MTLGVFNPIRDLQIYVDGNLIPIQTWSFDVTNNRYLLYMNQAINLHGTIQVVHHVPSPPFQFNANPPILNVQVGVEPDIDAGS